MRTDLAPGSSFLINDSGPAFSAPLGADPAQYPSVLLQSFIRQAWGLERNNGPIDYLRQLLPQLSRDDLGTIYAALSVARPNDRMGHTHFWQDLNYSSYSYERFYDEIQNAPSDEAARELILAKWRQDTEQLKTTLAGLDNFGYYFPQFRAVNESHCTSIIEFANADIQEAGLELNDFIDDILNGSGAVMQASETDTTIDSMKPFNLFYFLLDQIGF